MERKKELIEMKVYLAYENKTQSIAQVLISAWEKNIFVKKKCSLKLNDVDKTKSQRKNRQFSSYSDHQARHVTWCNTGRSFSPDTCLSNSRRHVLCSLIASQFSTHGYFISSKMTFLECTFVMPTHLSYWLTIIDSA